MQPYTLGECLRDLLDLSARLLVVGGRLVYFLPATPETYCEEEVPGHPALRLVANRWGLGGWVWCGWVVWVGWGGVGWGGVGWGGVGWWNGWGVVDAGQYKGFS